MFNRKNSRAFGSARKITVLDQSIGMADASLIFEQGNTKIFVSVSMQQGVPRFLKGCGKGWLTAEYVMHPYASDRVRSNREFAPNGRDQRSVEISRLIGRSFRSVCNLKYFGEKTIYIDCDVLQADGGTRTACITAATIALKKAENVWLANKWISMPVLEQPIFGLSAGILNGKVLLDLDKDEDVLCQGDFNFVMTKSGMIVEVQGTAESHPLSWDDINLCQQAVKQGIFDLATTLGL